MWPLCWEKVQTLVFSVLSWKYANKKQQSAIKPSKQDVALLAHCLFSSLICSGWHQSSILISTVLEGGRRDGVDSTLLVSALNKIIVLEVNLYKDEANMLFEMMMQEETWLCLHSGFWVRSYTIDHRAA